MKKVIPICIVMILASLVGFSQTPERLDQKNGFKTLKFRTTPDFNKCQDERSDDDNPNLKRYRYVDPGFQDLNGIPVLMTNVEYYNNKLAKIYVLFYNDISDAQIEDIRRELSILYGDPDIFHSQDSNWIGLSYGWYGERVILLLMITDYNNGRRECTISITDKEMSLQAIQDKY